MTSVQPGPHVWHLPGPVGVPDVRSAADRTGSVGRSTLLPLVCRFLAWKKSQEAEELLPDGPLGEEYRELSDMRSTFHIEAPVEEVFDFFFDPTKSADLNPIGTEIRELKMTEEGIGSYASYRTRIAGVPFEIFDVYTDVVPNKHITEKSSNAIVGTWDYDFEPEGTGTKVTMEHHSRSFWNLPPLRNLGDLLTARLSETYMGRVKDRIESSSAGAER